MCWLVSATLLSWPKQLVPFTNYPPDKSARALANPRALMEFVISPGIGIGPARLGMLRHEIHAVFESLPGAMDRHTVHRDVEWFFKAALQLEYGKDGGVLFVGASYYPSCGCTFSLLGQDPWRLPAEELFALVAKLDGGQHSFNPNEYVFPNIILSLWDADTQYDCYGGETRPVFAQVGVGNQAYLRAVERIRR